MYKYIAIEREYGSGGRAVARALSEKCGLPAYGREILEKAAEDLHIPVSQLEQYEENTTNSLLYSISMIGKAQSGDPDLLMREGHLFVAEQMAIRKLASRGPAIFLGHCGSEALKDCQHVLRVFIKSDPASRRYRITHEYGIDEHQVDAMIRKYDRRRSGYYTMNTASKWHDPDNYDVILDSGTLGIQGCTAALAALLET